MQTCNAGSFKKIHQHGFDRVVEMVSSEENIERCPIIADRFKPRVPQLSCSHLHGDFFFGCVFFGFKSFYKNLFLVFFRKLFYKCFIAFTFFSAELKITMSNSKIKSGLITEFAQHYRINSATYCKQQFIFWLEKIVVMNEMFKIIY